MATAFALPPRNTPCPCSFVGPPPALWHYFLLSAAAGARRSVVEGNIHDHRRKPPHVGDGWVDRCVRIQLHKWAVVVVAAVAAGGASAGQRCQHAGVCAPCSVGTLRVEGPELLCALAQQARGSGWGGARGDTMPVARQNGGQRGKAGEVVAGSGGRSHRRPGVGGTQEGRRRECRVCACNQPAPEAEVGEGDKSRGLPLCERGGRMDGGLGLAGERRVGNSPWGEHRGIHSVYGHHFRTGWGDSVLRLFRGCVPVGLVPDTQVMGAQV